VERRNGVPNGGVASGPPRCAAADFARFQRIAELFQVAHDQELAGVHAEERLTEVSGPLPAAAVTAGAVVDAAKNGLEYRPRDGGETWALMRKERRLVLEVNPGAEGRPEIEELTRLLNLVPGQRRYDVLVVSGTVADPLRCPTGPSAALRAVLRSTSQVYYFLANGVEVPAEHLRCGLAVPAVDADGRGCDAREMTRGLFTVHASAGHRPPATAYVAVRYRDYWYYVDDRDAPSKATLALMLQLSRFDFGRRRGTGPALTLPVGR
jgi:hypothetical protein